MATPQLSLQQFAIRLLRLSFGTGCLKFQFAQVNYIRLLALRQCITEGIFARANGRCIFEFPGFARRNNC